MPRSPVIAPNDLESGSTDPSGSENSPLLSSDATRNPANKRTNRASANRQYYFRLASGLVGIVLIVAIIALSERGASKPNGSTPDFTRLPPPQPGLRNPNYLASGYQGAVASEVNHCSEIGVEVLREGGTATDAGIATTLCIGVTNMFSSGIGGGGFMVIRPSTSHKNLNPRCTEPISIDFRETAPSASYPTMFSPRPEDPTFDPARASKIGGLAIGVPGEIRGLEAAYKACGGGVSWARLFQPSADLARKSHVGKELARRLSWAPFGEPLSSWMLGESEWRVLFAPKGSLLKEGEILRREAYAVTLETIGREGADVFYKGPIADSLISTISKAGGILTSKDLAEYKPIILPALRGTYLNRTYYTTHAPSGGPVIMSLLNTLEGYGDFVSSGRTGLGIHRFVEALKFAFAARTELGDPAYIKNDKKLAEIMTKEYAAEVRAKITDNSTHTIEYYNPHFDIKDTHGTTHLSVIDKYGSAVSITSTVNLLFGSRVLDVKTGIILNDEMDDFATPGIPDAFGLRPSPFNFPAGGKRPLSSTAPLIMDTAEGEVYLSVGGSGGSRIFGSIAQVLLNLDWGFDVSNAVEQARVHDQLSPAYVRLMPIFSASIYSKADTYYRIQVSIESGFRPDFIEALTSRGHNATLFDINLAIAECQAVVRNPDGKLFAASDSRKNGVPAAY